MENVTLDVIYKHVVKIEERLDNLEKILELPEVELSATELKKHNDTLKKMLKGEEGTSWEEYKKSR